MQPQDDGNDPNDPDFDNANGNNGGTPAGSTPLSNGGLTNGTGKKVNGVPPGPLGRMDVTDSTAGIPTAIASQILQKIRIAMVCGQQMTVARLLPL